MLRDGNIAGADVAGGLYDGTYQDNAQTSKIDIQVTMTAPAGITPVQTGIPLVSPLSMPITATVSQEDIYSEKPVLLQTPLGPVNVIFKKIRDF